MYKDKALEVLQNVASYFKERPSSWTKGWGTLLENATRDSAFIMEHLEHKDDKCCILSAITVFSVVLAGEEDPHRVKTEAVKILCEHHGLPVEDKSITEYNDTPGRTVFEAIRFVAAPFTRPGRNTSVEDMEKQLKKTGMWQPPTAEKALTA
jgi:hypothetical protein